MVKLSIDQTLLMAHFHAENGEIEKAEKLYHAILQSVPDNVQARRGLYVLNNLKDSRSTKAPPKEVINQLINLYNQRQFGAVAEQAQTLTEQYPSGVFVWNILGAAKKELGRDDAAIEAFKKVTELNPNYADGFNNLGTTLQNQNKLVEAIASYKKALSLKPEYAEAYYNMGNALIGQDKLDDAIASYNKALSFKPDYAEAHYNIGNALRDQAKLVEATASYKKALSLKPNYAEAYNNLGSVYKEIGELDKAIAYYKKALSFKPDFSESYNNMGIVFKEQGKLSEAISAYEKALFFTPNDARAYNNIGVVFKEQGRLAEAISSYSKALSLMPNNAEAYYNKGTALKDLGKLDEAIEAYENALSLDPDYANALAQKLYQQAHICDWEGISEDRSSLVHLGIKGQHISPFSVLPLEDAPHRHRLRSINYARQKFFQKPQSRFPRPTQKPERLRIGYFSSDFGEHPVAYLIVKVLETHNRESFEVFGYSIHNNKKSDLRQRLINAFDCFADVQGLSDKDVATQARQDGINIAIDLNGYTKNARTGIFAYRAAPIQINYLGYPGTLGTDFMDYIVADKHLIPPENQKCFNEKKLFLPYTYMPTDDCRKLSDRKITRLDMGLPNDAFVFCCFNNNYKISGSEFDIWMRLLNNVEGSVLWLRQTTQRSRFNIMSQAQKRKVDPSRIVFAERAPMDEHLARQKLANLFVDTFAFNAHTTATEALWAGLPVVTKIGQGFAARVAGSLLNSIGLPELITETKEQYEALALELATHPNKLTQIKEKLAANRLSKPLFNTRQYTKYLENGFQQAYQNYFEGNQPNNIIVPK